MKSSANNKNHKIAYIDGVAHQIKPDHTSVLKFVREYIGEKKIPTLCDDPNLAPFGACRICSVDVALKKMDQPKQWHPAIPLLLKVRILLPITKI